MFYCTSGNPCDNPKDKTVKQSGKNRAEDKNTEDGRHDSEESSRKECAKVYCFFECQTSMNLLQAVVSPRPTSTAKPRLGSAHKDSKAAAKKAQNKGLGKDSGTSCNTREDPKDMTMKQNRAKEKNREDSCDGSEESDKERAKVYSSLFLS